MRSAALMILLGVANAAAAPTADPALERAERELKAAGLESKYLGLDAAEIRRKAAATLGETHVGELLERLLASCLAGDKACEELHYGPRRDARKVRVAEALLHVLGATATRASGPLLFRLRGRWVPGAGTALERLLEREALAESARHPCRPPAAGEVSAARKKLVGFVVLRMPGRSMLARRPTPRELADLAYLFAAVPDPPVAVGRVAEAGVGAWHRPGRADPGQVALADSFRRARVHGDPSELADVARAYLESLGYPGPIRTGDEHHYSWGGPLYAEAMRELAFASEYLGDYEVAAALYRRANPGGGACGTSVSARWQDQVEGLIRVEERRGRCRAVVLERLIALHGSDDATYGPARLVSTGFDVERLYRGLLVTVNRDADPAEVEDAVRRAPRDLREAGLARHRERGPEAYEARTHAIEGLADVGRRRALPLLVRAARDGTPEVTVRALHAIGTLAAKGEDDPCRGTTRFGFSASNVWSRTIRPLNEQCAEVLRRPAADSLARSLGRFLDEADAEVSETILEALAKLGAPAAKPFIQRVLADPRRSEAHVAARRTLEAITAAKW